MFKVNNKDARTTSMTSFWCFIVNFEHISQTYFTPSSVSVDFEQVNVSWEIGCSIFKYNRQIPVQIQQ